RLDKIRLAALEAVLRLYADPDRLAERLPALRLLARPHGEIAALGQRLLPAVGRMLEDNAKGQLAQTRNPIGSGARPLSSPAPIALALRPPDSCSGTAVEGLARALRTLPIPVIGRIEAGRVLLDLRCLEDEPAFLDQLRGLHGAKP